MNNIFLDLGVVKIYWYSVILLIAFLIGGALALKEAKKHNISEEFMTNYFFYLVPIVIIGARLYFVIFNFDYYKDNLIDILKRYRVHNAVNLDGGASSSLVVNGKTYSKPCAYSADGERLIPNGWIFK